MNPDELRLIEHRPRPHFLNQLVIHGRQCDAPPQFSWVLLRVMVNA